MKAELYQQSFDGCVEMEIRTDEEYIKITCVECEGTGVFEITPEDKQECVNCKTSGYIYVNVS